MIKIQKLNQVGVSIIEVLFASAGLMIVFLAALSFANDIKKRSVLISGKRSYVSEYEKIANLIISDPKLFKISFDPSEKSKCALLDQAKLPIAWDHKNVYEIEDCPDCPGRIGYVIQPYNIPTFRGVYKVTFRMSHTTLTKGQTAICDGTEIPDAQQIELIVGLR